VRADGLSIRISNCIQGAKRLKSGTYNEGKVSGLGSVAGFGVYRGAASAEPYLRESFGGLLFFFGLLQKRHLLTRL
jgi:hypothetical protein